MANRFSERVKILMGKHGGQCGISLGTVGYPIRLFTMSWSQGRHSQII